MTKPSLHELISKEISLSTDLSGLQCGELAERIIKIVRDYHLVEDKPREGKRLL
jgi:hypothetical protein